MLKVALFLLVAVLLRQVLISLLFELAQESSFHFGTYRATLASIRALRLLGAPRWMRPSLLQLTVHAREALGQTASAVEGARRLVGEARALRSWDLANTAINTFINAGLYEEALEVERRWERQETPEVEPLDTEEGLVQLNLAEALYNLGDWEAASERLQGVEKVVEPQPLLKHALLMQRAWIQANTGRGADALETLARVDRQSLPRVYWSEVAFTHAAALLAVGRYEEAEREVRAGLECARRVASTRNGLFLLGRIALRAGRLDEALPHFEAGAAHPYRGQGGRALLEWGDCLERLGQGSRAREVWRLVLERDPRSEAAREAASRLDQGAEVGAGSAS
ncbi:MAG TPA: tetratricopeptide repeat protein [Archangium sp.]|jgi:tetratricopeptide (TPR) repeat protein|uniref:tetratricopeptide repeat protein n=1 Tax=Archangium sp. TaxID=1872627 RepID=UPI002ED8BB55